MAANQILSLPAAATGLAPVSSATAWTYGTAVTASASLPVGINIIGLQFQVTNIPTVDATQEILFDITIGGTTKVQIPYTQRSDTAVGHYQASPQTIFFPEPYSVPGGSAVAVQVTDSLASAITYDGVKILYQENTPPTVALDTPTDAATGVSTTPALLFTGTDVDSDEIEYNVQVDTVNTFDSKAGTNAINNPTFNTNILDWYQYTSAGSYTISHETTTTHSGAGSFKIVSTSGTTCDGGIAANANAGGTTDIGFSISLVASTTYYLSVWIKTGASVANAHCVLQDSSYAAPIQFHQTSANVDWTLFSGSFTTTAAISARILIGLGSYGSASDGTAYFDDLYLGTGPLLDKLSVTPDATFTGTGDPHPWPSGNQVTYTVQAGNILTASTVYYWRVRGTDPLGSNTYGAWSATRSFTTLSISTMLMMGV